MNAFVILTGPTFGRASGLWLVTICLGTLFIALYIGFAGDSSAALGVALFAGAFAGFYSLPILLFLPFGIKWALAGATATTRYLRLFGSITVLFGLATVLCYLGFADGDGDDLPSLVAVFAAPYFVAAMLAAYRLYAAWLNVPPTE